MVFPFVPGEKPVEISFLQIGILGLTQSNARNRTETELDVRSNRSKLSRRQAIKSAVVTTAAVSFSFPRAINGDKPRLEGNDRPVGRLVERTQTSDSALKRRARADYAKSLARYGGRFSNSINNLLRDSQNPHDVHFGVVVVGSGYGASACAARLSKHLRLGHRMCILERGREWVPGSFPDTFPGLAANTTTILAGPKKGQLKNPLGLFNLMMNDEINLLTGNGLGGGSLINASIALRPQHEVFSNDRWPDALKDVRVMAPYYEMVARQMSLARTPIDHNPKIRARRLAGERLSREHGFFDVPNVSVMYDYRHLDELMRNPQGMVQRLCTHCGDCTTGCNIGAKNTLLMNYLPVAKWNGTEFYTQCQVDSIQKCEGYYRLNLTYFRDSKGEITRKQLSINSRMVVIGAGSPGSAMILKDSQSDEFQFSSALGRHWSGNGDTIGFVIKMPGPTNIGGFGAYQKECRERVGPTVQTSLNYYSNKEDFRRLLVQEASIPRGASNILSALLRDRDLNNSMIMLAMSHDGADGYLERADGRWKIKWPGLEESANRRMVFGEFERLAAAHGGKYKRLKLFGNNLVTVHPLGGCAMSDNPVNGVVNHLGQVFDGFAGCCENLATGEAQVHHGLYVADGSIIPTAIGVNPYMTIGALAERIANHILHNPVHTDLFEETGS